MIPWQIEGVHGTSTLEVSSTLPGMGAGGTLQAGAPLTLDQQGGHGQGSRAATGSGSVA